MHRRNSVLIIFTVLALPVFSGIAWAVEWTPKDRSRAEELHKLKCAKCHKLYEPADYEMDKWDAWLLKMKKKARLKDDQYELILNFTREQAKKGQT
jgi:hypothetical protein